jgi:hypothetical protein
LLLVLTIGAAFSGCSARSNSLKPKADLDLVERVWQAHWDTLLKETYSDEWRSADADSDFAREIDFFQNLTGIISNTQGLLGVIPTHELETKTIPAWAAWFEKNKGSLEVALSQCPISLRTIDESDSPEPED